MIQIIQASTPGQFASGRRLFDEYAASLPFDLDFQDFATELRNLRNIYSPPNGALLLAVDAAYGHDSNAARAGCIALRELEQSDDGIRTGEVKRLYVPDEYRGRKIGQALTGEIIKTARKLGFAVLRLDSMGFMQSAIAIYRSFGFAEIAAYRYNPFADAVYMELRLDQDR